MFVRAVIDTNVWISSLLNPSGYPAELRRLFESGKFHLVISEQMIEELVDVLGRPRIRNKFNIADEDISELLRLLEERSEIVAVTGVVSACRDKDDDIVLETAFNGGAAYLVTRDDDLKFDKELLTLLEQHGVTALSVNKFLEFIR